MSLFEARGVAVRYGSVHALKKVDLSLEAGAVHGVIGPNGAGKSTLVDALTGRCDLHAGSLNFDGEDITSRSVRRRRRMGISRSFQRTSTFPSMTVRDQLNMVARHHRDKGVEDIVGSLGLRPYLDAVCSEIAYGTQRSVDLALALVGRPRVLLLDEPCAGLLHSESVQMLDLVAQLCAERRIAGLLVEHDVDGVFRTCDVVTVLDLGEVLVSGEPERVRKDEQVIRAYLGVESAA